MVALAAYPEPVARKLFGHNAGSPSLRADAHTICFSDVRAHIRKQCGFDLPAAVPTEQNLQYLAGMIHYSLLRQALVTGYGV